MGIFDIDYGNVARIPTIVKPPSSQPGAGVQGGTGTQKIGGRGVGYWHIVTDTETIAFNNGKRPRGTQVFRIFSPHVHNWNGE